ncbi:MAG TPA: flagellar motor protein MotB, partial [Gammaproteobacteria bacterium]|nr:flagellar motor protein MotB [Gammaproteobacteria bacterium]
MDDAPQKKPDVGIPAWVMTFADLMSLLLSFFVLLLSFSEMDVNKYKMIAGSMSEAFGVQRKIKVNEPPRGINVVAREFSPALPQPTVLNVVQQQTANTLSAFLATKGDKKTMNGSSVRLKQDAKKASKKSDARKSESDKKAEQEKIKDKLKDKGKSKAGQSDISAESEKAARLAQQMKLNAERIRKALEKEIRDGSIEVESTDQKILIRIRDKIAFTPGSATLKDGFEEILMRIGKILRTTTGKITVAGHTDNQPIHNYYFLSNWDLSAMRAVVVMRELHELAEINEQRFKVEGNADTMPLVANDSLEHRAQNRRVEIILTKGDDLMDNADPVKSGQQAKS